MLKASLTLVGLFIIFLYASDVCLKKNRTPNKVLKKKFKSSCLKSNSCMMYSFNYNFVGIYITVVKF